MRRQKSLSIPKAHGGLINSIWKVTSIWRVTSVIDYVRKTDEESVPISSDRARAESVQKCKHARQDREPSKILYKKASSLFSEGKVIIKNVVHYLKKKVLSS